MTAYATAAAAKASHATAGDNVLLWDRTTEGYSEIYFVTFNHRESKTGFWLRHTLVSPAPGTGPSYAQLWFAFFDAVDPTKNFALNKKIPIGELRAEAAPFQVTIAGAVLGHDHARGALSGDGHSASWDLAWLPSPASLRLMPKITYRPSFPSMRVIAPNLDIPLRGTVVVDGRTLTFDGEPGTQSHIWGRKDAQARAWSHCSAFEGQRGTVIETLTSHLKRGPVALPAITFGALRLDGEDHLLTGFRNAALNRGKFGTGFYDVRLQSPTLRIDAHFSCRPQDMVCAEYFGSAGTKSYCHNTEVGDARVVVSRRGRFSLRWQEQVVLTSEKAAHFEIVTKEPDPAITRRHVTLP